jgi:phosphoadenosine phosphosulfate reductase
MHLPGSDAQSMRATATPLAQKAAQLNAKYRHHGATDVIGAALRDMGHIALVSSFGAESVVLLHMAALIDKATPVLFIDTELLFTETLVYQGELSERLGLSNLRILRAGDIRHRDADATLHKTNPDACCLLRKTAPLQNALSEFDGWITGRKRFQSGARAALDFFECETGASRIKINPLAHWSREDVVTYVQENRLPRHPLSSRGYGSIGCAPCTTPTAPGEEARAGRWRNRAKTECGIHFGNGKLTRTGEPA